MKLVLYYFPITCSMVPYINLLEAGAEFEVSVVNVKRGEHMQENFLRLNPKRKVPVLAIDGQPLTENVAIQIWIARNFPQAKLLPAQFDEYKAISLMAWFASGIHPSLTPNFLPQRYCDVPGTEDAVRRCAQTLLHGHFEVANKLLEGREFFFDHYTAADGYFFWCFRRAVQFKVDVSKYSHCSAHFERVQQRPSVQKALAFETSVLAEDQAS